MHIVHQPATSRSHSALQRRLLASLNAHRAREGGRGENREAEISVSTWRIDTCAIQYEGATPKGKNHQVGQGFHVAD